MASPYQFPGTPSMPLFPVSPERVNGLRGQPQSPNGLPPSPSMPDLVKPKHNKSNSEVQSMVARFNSLDIRDHVELRKKDEAALKRAQMGREEAEEQLKRVREESRKLKRDLDDGGDRERKMMKRIDTVMEDLHRSKETHHHAQLLYEKEIRRARKEAFKSSSIVVKLQEELKSTRNSLKGTRADLDLEKHKVGRREQDAFAAQYEIVGVQERLCHAQEQVKILEQERDALKTSLKEEEVARVAAEGQIALPPSQKEDEEFRSPQKYRSPTKEAVTLSHQQASEDRIQLEQALREIEQERYLRELAQGRIEFMNMECQFQCCSCRVAENTGIAYVHDGELDAQIQLLKPTASVGEPPAYSEMQVDSPDEAVDEPGPHEEREATPLLPDQEMVDQGSDEDRKGKTHMTYSPNSGTFHSQSSLKRDQPSTPTQPVTIEEVEPEEKMILADCTNLPPSPISIARTSPTKSVYQASMTPTPHRPMIRTYTTTTTIPLAGGTSTPVAASKPINAASTDPRGSRSHTPADYPANITPAKGLTREEAIERLRQQRADHRGQEVEREGAGGKENAGWGSVKGTPMKRAVSHHATASEKRPAHRRDISAPEIGGATPGRARRR